VIGRQIGEAPCPINAERQFYLNLGFLLRSITPLGNNERMSDHVYKKIEVVGSSPNGFEDAIKNALARAEKTVRNMRWFEVTETRGDVENGKVGHWQVTLKIGFTLE
jgi:dodecin